MRQVEARKLWNGSAGDLRDDSTLTAAGIVAIVELDDAGPMAALPLGRNEPVDLHCGRRDRAGRGMDAQRRA